MPQEYASIDLRRWQDDPYDTVVERFEWDIPERYNVATEICEDHVGSDSVALQYVNTSGTVEEYTFAELDAQASALASGLRDRGVSKGSRVGIALSQTPETLVAHIASYKLGAIAVPISVLMGLESVTYRLEKASVSVLITDAATTSRLGSVLDPLSVVVTIDDGDVGESYETLVAEGTDTLSAVETMSGDPCLITFTSGTTGKPKGVVYAHRQFASFHNGFEVTAEFPDDAVVFTPADWAWVAGTYDTAFPAWRDAHTVVGYESAGFDPAFVFEVMERTGVTHTLLTSTMIHMMMEAEVDLDRSAFDLEVILTGGEPTTQRMFDWVNERFDGVRLNEHFGQTEADLLLSNGRKIVGTKEMSLGRPVPGHDIEIIDESGTVLPPNETGHIAVRSPDPAIMLEYWDDPAKTDGAFIGDWLDTGDFGYKDEDGFFWFSGRGDDLIIASGYRVSPIQVERKLEEHPAVSKSVVFGAADPDRGEIVTAVIELAMDVDDRDALAAELRDLVREDLAKYMYPRRIEFIDVLPKTSTGKIARQDIKDRFGDAGD